MNPRVLKQDGFKHLDRVIGLCAQHGIYTILDLHTAPGGQVRLLLNLMFRHETL
jgi:aryl-phospho-beta-D-glucosidase BglC (GH1 family)